MSDFDFDEIDEAVSHAIATNDNDTPTSPQSTEDTSSTETPASPRTSTMPAVHRGSGRFMDMVHPSSDMHSRREFTPPRSVSARPPVNQTIQPTETVRETANTPDDEPSPSLESPFLPDTKVEKRPLGSMPPVDTPPQVSATETPHEPILIEAPDEQVLIEASDEPLLEATNEPEPPMDEQAHTSIYIPQQYQEQPSSAQPSSPLYDTTDYNQPVATKQTTSHSGVWIVLWIILLIIVGAASGVAIYLFVLPLLSV